MPLGIFGVSFSDENTSLDFSILHTNEVTPDDILGIFSGMEIEARTIQYFSTSVIKILYYAIGENDALSMLGIVLSFKEAEGLFVESLKEEAELLLGKDRDATFSDNLKSSYRRIVQKAIKNIEERIAEAGRGKSTENSDASNLEKELKKFYDEEKRLVAELEREGETNSTIEKIETVIAKQKQLEERIRAQKDVTTAPDDTQSDLRDELRELQQLYNQIKEFKVVQSFSVPEEAVKKEIEEKKPKPVEKAASTPEVSELMKRLQKISAKQSESQSNLVSAESYTPLESETTTMYNKTIEPLKEIPRSKTSSVLESESDEARLSRILIEKFGEAKSIILEYLYWYKKPRTIIEIAQDLEIPAEKIVKTIEDLLKNGTICQLTRKNVEEVYLTLCPGCPLQPKCGKERPIDWTRILSKT
ncbi:MAG: hypothetical protein WED07_05130 [Candidatus Freyarchaeum deiterrae]